MSLHLQMLNGSSTDTHPVAAPACFRTGSLRKQRERGFSLIELIIALALAAIVVTMAAPAMNGMVKDGRLTATTNTLSTAFNYARLEAINRNENVSVVAPSGNWVDGWEVRDATGTPVRKFPATASNITVTSAGGTSTFIFGSGGRITGQDTLTICDDRVGATGRTLTVGERGRIAVGNVVCN